jgi:3-deoxy-D-manno-octulosonic-acid transferase
MSLAWSAYRMVAPWLGAMAPGVRWLASPAERPLWSERLGHVRSPGGCDAWVHAASLGEALAVGPLLGELRALEPAARFWLTAATRSGRARLESLGEPTSLAPLDAPQIVQRFFDGIGPKRLLLVETELWPHWLLRARLDQVPVAVLSARLSMRSLTEYRRLGTEFRALLGELSAVIAQTEEDADRWVRLGAPRARTAVAGNLKNDALPVAAEDRGASRRELGLEVERPLLVLGNVRPGEARLLARAWAGLPEPIRRRWQVVAVPRHPRAAPDLRIEAREAAEAARHGAGDAWRWVDQLGGLSRYYAVADAAFVGGSLLSYGGHNPLEPAACGAAVLMGAHYESQRSGVAALDVRRAIRIVDGSEQLASAFRDVLGDEARCRALGEVARSAVAPLRGATKRTVARLVGWRLWADR